MESMVRILGAFVDTLVLNVYPTDHDFEIEERRIDESLKEELMLLKGQAQELEEDVPRGEPLDARGLSGVFERLRERAGITDKPVYSHQGRRFMATTQLGDGRNPLDVQRQMGHTTLMMTNRYYSQTVEGLRESHEDHSPLRKLSVSVVKRVNHLA